MSATTRKRKSARNDDVEEKRLKKRLKKASKAVDDAQETLHEARENLKEAKNEMDVFQMNKQPNAWIERFNSVDKWTTWYDEYAKKLSVTKLPSEQARRVVQFALSNYMECRNVEWMPYFFYEAKSRTDASAFQTRLDELIETTPALFTERPNLLWFMIYLARDPTIIHDALNQIRANAA